MVSGERHPPPPSLFRKEKNPVWLAEVSVWSSCSGHPLGTCMKGGHHIHKLIFKDNYGWHSGDMQSRPVCQCSLPPCVLRKTYDTSTSVLILGRPRIMLIGRYQTHHHKKWALKPLYCWVSTPPPQLPYWIVYQIWGTMRHLQFSIRAPVSSPLCETDPASQAGENLATSFCTDIWS